MLSSFSLVYDYCVSIYNSPKYVVGIDIAKNTFMACFGRIDLQQYVSFGKEITFANTLAGFAALLA